MTNQCHDITVFPSQGIAGGACSGNGIIFDISDPFNPTRIDEEAMALDVSGHYARPELLSLQVRRWPGRGIDPDEPA